MVTGNDFLNNGYDLSVLSNKTSLCIFADSIFAMVFICCIFKFHDIQIELNLYGESSTCLYLIHHKLKSG